MMIEILIVVSVIFLIARTRISKRGTATQEIMTITIRLTDKSAFEFISKTSRRSGRKTIQTGIVSRKR